MDLDPFAARSIRGDLIGGPLDSGGIELPDPGLGAPFALTLARRCEGCGHFHPYTEGAYRLVGRPARGYPGQYLWRPGDPLD